MAIANRKIAPSLRLGAITSLTDNTGGTVSDTLAVIADAPTANAIASLASKFEALKSELESKGYQNT